MWWQRKIVHPSDLFFWCFPPSAEWLDVGTKSCRYNHWCSYPIMFPSVSSWHIPLALTKLSTDFSFRSYWQVLYWVSLFPQKERLLVSFYVTWASYSEHSFCLQCPWSLRVTFLWHIFAWLLTFHYKSVFFEDNKYLVFYDYRNGRSVFSWTGHLSHGHNCWRLASKAKDGAFFTSVPEYHYCYKRPTYLWTQGLD